MSGLDLYQTQRALALLFVYAAVLGFCLGVLYDLLRFLRIFCGEKLTGGGQGSNHPLTVALRFLTDLVFSLVTAVSLILLCYYANDGQFRASALWGMIGGFFVYMQTVGRLTVKPAVFLSGCIKRGMRLTLGLLLRPLRAVGRLLVKPLRFLLGLLTERARKGRERKEAERAAQDLIDAAKRGFTHIAGGEPTEKNR